MPLHYLCYTKERDLDADFFSPPTYWTGNRCGEGRMEAKTAMALVME